ncbi:MAG: hypothetical protein AABW50_00560 [Nanoarchaeota archaeon]
MASANYIFGRDLSLDDFDKYILPLLNQRGVFVQDKMVIPYVEVIPFADGTRLDDRKVVLTTLVGNDLSAELIRKDLEIAHEEVEKNFRASKTKHEHPAIYGHQLHPDDLRIVGTYHEDEAGSKLFASVALSYLLESHEQMAEEIEENVRSLLEKKLNEF